MGKYTCKSKFLNVYMLINMVLVASGRTDKACEV